MNDDPEQLDKHVEDLLQDRRPERTPLGDEGALRARQTAAMLLRERSRNRGKGSVSAQREQVHGSLLALPADCARAKE